MSRRAARGEGKIPFSQWLFLSDWNSGTALWSLIGSTCEPGRIEADRCPRVNDPAARLGTIVQR
jgi:hypothetical protein